MTIRSTSLGFAALNAAACWFAVATLRNSWNSLLLPIVFGEGTRIFVAALGLVSLIGAAETGRVLWRWRRGHPETDVRVRLLGLAQVALGCLIVTTVVLELRKPEAAHVVFAIGYGVYVLWTWALPLLRSIFPRRLRRVALIVGVNVLVTIVLAEAALRVASLIWPNPILATASMPDHIRRVADRSPPGTIRFGFPVNSGGHYDSEVAPRSELPGPLVVSIGDSFSYGIVPHPLNFTTIAEQQLRGVEVYNVGFPGIGPSDYRYLLEHEGLPLEPDLVVIHLFLGNDLHDGAQIEEPPRWFTADNYMTATVWQRLNVLRTESGLDLTRTAEEAATTTETMFARRHWLADPLLEEPRMSEELFLDLEVERAQGILGSSAWHDLVYGQFFDKLQQIVRTAGNVPIAFVLMPDEFQVDDAVWEDVIARTGPLDRDRAQREIVAWMKSQGLPVLDLLPVFRSVEPLADGRRHLFHLRETHTNARGNEVAGREMARFIRSLLPVRATLPLQVNFEGEVRPWLREGWHDPEMGAGHVFSWGRGERSILELPLPADTDVQLELECQPFVFPGAPPQRVSVVLNDRVIEELRLRPDWGRYSVRLPKEAIREPLNQLEFRYTYSHVPSQVLPDSEDNRSLAVAWYSIGLWADAARQLIYHGRASDRVKLRGGFTMSFEVQGPDALASSIRQSNPILAIREMRIEGEGERFISAVDPPELAVQVRLDRVEVTGTHGDKPFHFEFDGDVPPSDLSAEPIKQIAYGLGRSGRRFRLGRFGEYAITDADSDAGGEAMGVVIDAPVRLPAHPVRVGDTWTAEWMGTRKAPETDSVFSYRQSARLEEMLANGSRARISFKTTGTLEIPAERAAERGEDTTMVAEGMVVLDLITGQVVGVESSGAITSKFTKAGFTLVRGLKAHYQER